MINWCKTEKYYTLNQDTVRSNCKDRVIVTCEKCQQDRPQIYSVAKRKNQHICLSCVKTKDVLYPEIDIERSKVVNPKLQVNKSIFVKCGQCNEIVRISFNRKWFPNFICGRCRLKNKWRNGDYTVPIVEFTDKIRSKISSKASANWSKLEYREKWTKTFQLIKDKRSKSSKQVWSDPHTT